MGIKMNEATYTMIRKKFDKSMLKIDWIEDRETRETLESLQIQMNEILLKHFESNRDKK